MKKPFISILIPNYNHAHYLSKCLRSVLIEAPQDSEILVIDDASTDNSVDIIQSFLTTDTRVKLYKNRSNKGVNATVNYGLELVNGEYFFGLSADDQLLPGFFGKTLTVLRNHREVNLCSSDYAYFYDDKPENIFINRLMATDSPYLILHPEQTVERFRKTDFWIPGHTSVVRTEIARRYGGYQNQIRHFSDFYLVHRIALTQPIAYIPEGLSAMRLVSNSFSAQSHANPKIRYDSCRNLLNLILKDECKKLFQKSTLLRPTLKSNLLRIIFTPKYWGFLWPVIFKKGRKILSNLFRFPLNKNPRNKV